MDYKKIFLLEKLDGKHKLETRSLGQDDER